MKHSRKSQAEPWLRWAGVEWYPARSCISDNWKKPSWPGRPQSKSLAA